MPDTITRWECPECGRAGLDNGHHGNGLTGEPCPGVPVERVYVAVDALREAAKIAERDSREGEYRDYLAVLRAIAAVTGEQA